MEKILNIDGRNVKFKSTGAYLLRYKAQFQRDAIQDMLRLEQSIDSKTRKIKKIEAFDLEVFYNLVWTLAKTADPSIPPPMEWLDGFSEFPLEDILPDVMDMITSCIRSSAKAKKK